MTNAPIQEPNDDNTYIKEALLSEIGATLREARVSKSISREAVIESLKFSPHFLDALETGNWSDLPGEVYAIGFLRQYAKLLELDVEPLIERIKSNAFELTAPLTYPDAPISPNKTWVALALLLFIAVFIFMNLSEQDETPSPNIALPAQVQTLAEQAAGKTSEVIITETLPQEDQASNLSADQTPSTAEIGQVDEVKKTNKTMVVDVIQSNLANEADTKTYSFFAAHEDVWLQVFEQIGDNEPVLLREALLKAGQRFSVKTGVQLLLTSGNSVALQVSKDQAILFETGSLGVQGKVLKKYLLP